MCIYRKECARLIDCSSLLNQDGYFQSAAESYSEQTVSGYFCTEFKTRRETVLRNAETRLRSYSVKAAIGVTYWLPCCSLVLHINIAAMCDRVASEP